MANPNQADSSSYNQDYKWTRVSADVSATSMRIEFSPPCSAEKDKIPEFRHEGFQKPSVTGEVRIINLTCSGEMCVDQHDPMCRCTFTVNPKDTGGK